MDPPCAKATLLPQPPARAREASAYKCLWYLAMATRLVFSPSLHPNKKKHLSFIWPFNDHLPQTGLPTSKQFLCIVGESGILLQLSEVLKNKLLSNNIFYVFFVSMLWDICQLQGEGGKKPEFPPREEVGLNRFTFPPMGRLKIETWMHVSMYSLPQFCGK